MTRICLALPLLLLFACGVNNKKEAEINYLDMKRPGLAAEEFAPGIVSTDSFEHSSPVFSPDGTVVLWNIIGRVRKPHLREMTFENGKWSAPHTPSFADTTADDFYPSFSSDGRTLYFSSRRKVPEGYQQRDMYVWKVERNNNTWGTPVMFDSLVSNGMEYAHSITDDNKLYFSARTAGETNFDIRVSQSSNGKYTGAVSLPFGINSINYEDGAMIAPDESFLIFESQRAEGMNGSIDLYVSFKLDDESWSLPVNMGPAVNSNETERMAKLSPDGKYLFFGSTRGVEAPAWGFDIFWIDAKVIDELRNNPLANTAIDQPLGDELMNVLSTGNTDRAAELLKAWTNKYPDDAEGARVYLTILRKQKKYEEAEGFIAAMPAEFLNYATIKMDVALTKFGAGKKDEAIAVLEPLLAPSKDLEIKYRQLVNGLTDMGLYDLADEYFEKLAAIGIHPVHTYNRACFYSKAGETNRAFKYLEQAADKGYNSLSQYENDSDLTQLKSDRRWARLRKKLK